MEDISHSAVWYLGKKKHEIHLWIIPQLNFFCVTYNFFVISLIINLLRSPYHRNLFTSFQVFESPPTLSHICSNLKGALPLLILLPSNRM